MNHAASCALPLSAATRHLWQLRLPVCRRKISCAGDGLLSFNCCCLCCCCCCSLVAGFVCLCFCFLHSLPYGLTIECSSYVCVCTWASLGSFVCKHIYVATCCCISFQNFTIHQSTPARQAGKAGSENSCPSRSCLICIQRTLPHTHPTPTQTVSTYRNDK